MTTSAGRMMTDGHRVKSRSILCDISHKWVKSLDRKLSQQTSSTRAVGRSAVGIFEALESIGI